MGFQIACLVADPCIAGSVGLVERIFRELSPVIVDFLQFLLWEPVGHTTVDEFLAELFNDGYLFLSHCFTQLVGLTFREACKFLGQKHDLLLIDCDSICVV